MGMCHIVSNFFSYERLEISGDMTHIQSWFWFSIEHGCVQIKQTIQWKKKRELIKT